MSTQPNDASPLIAERWLSDHGDALYAYGLQRVRDAHVAEDLVQETLLAAMRSATRYAGRSSERTWLIGILKHKLIDHIRKSIREKPAPEARPDEDSSVFDEHGHWKVRMSAWGGDPRQTAENAEFQRVLATCLAKLPLRTAQVFWLHEAESMASEELCNQLQISPTNLWTMLHRARVGLQRCLSINWFESADRS